MPITKTDLHRKEMIESASSAILRLQHAVRENAEIHRQWAVDETYTLVDLQTKITDTVAAYESIRASLRNFRDVTIPADPGFLTVGDSLKLTLSSVGQVGTEVADHIDAFDLLPRNTFAEIISACDYLIANVDLPERVFP